MFEYDDNSTQMVCLILILLLVVYFDLFHLETTLASERRDV